MKYRLKKDVVIPAGTVFDTAPWKTTRELSEAPFDGAIDAIIGLTKDTSGVFTYHLDSADRDALEEYFEEVGEQDGQDDGEAQGQGVFDQALFDRFQEISTKYDNLRLKIGDAAIEADLIPRLLESMFHIGESGGDAVPGDSGTAEASI